MEKTLKNHKTMVEDPQRKPLLKAIASCVKRGNVIFDLGCGTGVLTMAALNAGAQKVYACDVSEVIKVAKAQVAKAKLSRKVEFFESLSSEIKLPEEVDGIISETVGSLGVDENILPFLIDARDRFLKPGGFLIPQKMEIFAVPLGALPHLSNQEFQAYDLDPKSFLAKPKHLIGLDFFKTNFVGIDKTLKFVSEKKGVLGGIGAWIEVEWAPGLKTLTSPEAPSTHWKQALLPIPEKPAVAQGTPLLARIRVSPLGHKFSWESDIEWGYKVGK